MFSVSVKRRELINAIQNVSNAIKENKVIPVVSGVYIEGGETEGILSIRGTDLELTIINEISAAILGKGAFIVKPYILLDYLKEIEDETIEIVSKDNKVIVNTARSSAEFSVYDLKDYPKINYLHTANEYKIDAVSFLEGLEKTMPAASPVSDNLAIHCIRLEIEGSAIKLISSDSYRMFYFEKTSDAVSGTKLNLKASIPLKTVDSIIKIIKYANAANLTIQIEKNQVLFKIENIMVFSKLIDLPYPDYKNIISGVSFDKNILCNTKELLSLLKRVRIFSKDNIDIKNGGTFDFKGNKLSITGISSIAKVKEEMVVSKSGDDLSISLNVKFLLDYLTNFAEDNVYIKLSNSEGAVLLQPEKDGHFICLTMPLAQRG